MGDLERDTAVVGSDGAYRARLSADWEIWGPMGGYVATVALRAAACEVAPGQDPASLSCQFFAPARFEEVDISVEVRRASRRTTATAVRVTQQGTPILDAQVWFAVPGDVVEHDHMPLHRHGAPDDHPPITSVTSEPPPFPFWNNFEGRPIDWIEDWEAFPGGEPEWAQWVRYQPRATFDDPVMEAARLVLLADLPSFPAAIRAYPWEQRTFVSPSLDLAVQLHRLRDAGDWLLVEGHAPIAERGLMGFRSEIWGADARLLASGGGQLLLRPAPAPG
jgi:acyl-CoA thioesterase-2